MTIGSLCCRNVDTASPHESVHAAAQRMGTRGVGTLVVTDDANQVVGILTDRDVAVRVVGAPLDPVTTLVSEVMTREMIHTGFETMTIEDALHLMRAQSIRRLVVVRPDGTLSGILSLDDVLAHLAEELRDVGELIRKEDPRPVLASACARRALGAGSVGGRPGTLGVPGRSRVASARESTEHRAAPLLSPRPRRRADARPGAPRGGPASARCARARRGTARHRPARAGTSPGHGPA